MTGHENQIPEADLAKSEIQSEAANIAVGAPVTNIDSSDMSLDAALSAEDTKDKTPMDAKKKKQILFGAGGLCGLIVILSLFSCQPAKGSLAYGICSTFLELQTPYPHTLQHIWLEGSRTAVRIYFTSTDPFGEYRQEMIECTFGPDEVMGMKLTQVTRNRRPVDPETVRKFNITLPAIMASDPYVVVPPNWKNPLLRD